MATKIRKTKLKEAEPMQDQNMTQATAQPATQEDMAAAPASAPAEPIDMPAVDEQAAPIADDPATDSPIEVEPATVTMEVKVPTDQLAAAVAQSTGDVVPAETAPDAMASQEADLVQASEPADMPAGTEGGEEAPVEDQNQQQPVMESQEKITEGYGEKEAAEAAEKHDQDKLEQIIDTGVKNQGIGAMENGNTSDGQNRLDLIKDGVDNMKESAEDVDEEIEAPEEEDAVDEPVEDKIKSAGIVDTEDLPSMGDDADADEEIDEMFDEPDSDEFINNIEDFLAKEDAEDVADALRTAASFLDQIAVKPGEKKLDFDELVNGEEEEEAEEAPEDEVDETTSEEVEDEDPTDIDGLELSDEEIDFDGDDPDEDEFDEEEDMYESVQARPAYTTSRRQTRKPYVTQGHPLKENSIIYPVGSEPLSQTSNNDYDMVRRQERLSQSRREAIKNYRRTLLEESDNRQNRTKFNEALKSSVRSVREREDYRADSWESNNFTSKYKERFNYKELLNNHLLG